MARREPVGAKLAVALAPAALPVPPNPEIPALIPPEIVRLLFGQNTLVLVVPRPPPVAVPALPPLPAKPPLPVAIVELVPGAVTLRSVAPP